MNRLLGFLLAPYYWVVEQKEYFLRNIFKKLTWLSPDFWCYVRMMAAVVIIFLSERGYQEWALALYIIAILTDLFDGAHARATNQVTESGAKLDANADKVLIGVILLFVGVGVVSAQVIMMFVLIESMLFFTANFLKPYLMQKYGYPFSVGSNTFGKIKMMIQSIAVGLLLVDPYSPILVMVCEYSLWVAVIIFGIGSLLGHLYRFDQPVSPRMRVVTIPNVITLSGIILLIPTGFSLHHENWNVAFALLLWIFISDWIDGKLARMLKQETAFGAVLDPVRDYLVRFFVIVWFFVWFDNHIIRIAIIAVIMVEIFSALVNLYTARKCKTVTLVNNWGKYRATGHYILLGVVFFHKMTWYELSENTLTACFLAMLACSLVALISYVKQQSTLMLQGVDNINRRD